MKRVIVAGEQCDIGIHDAVAQPADRPLHERYRIGEGHAVGEGEAGA